MPLDFDPERNTQSLFVTQLGVFTVPNAAEINPVLAGAIRDRAEGSRNWGRSNVGGWRSSNDLLEWLEVKQTDFEETVRSAVLAMVRHVAGNEHLEAELSLGAWCNLNREGAFNTPHNHPGHLWSGVYYVAADLDPRAEARESGRLLLQDPRTGANMVSHPGKCPWGQPIYVTPKPGLMVLFPAWLQHQVLPFRTGGERISIAFNAKVLAFEERHPV